MTLSSTTNRNNYTGAGTTDTYNYTFRVIREEDIKVITTELSTEIDTVLTLTTNYTVTGVGLSGGGTVVLTAGNLAATHRITIKRVVSITQDTDIRNQGAFFANVHEDEFDRGVMADQQQQDELDRAATLPESVDPANFDMTLPDLTGEDSITIATNVAGNAFVKGPTTGAISGAAAEAAAAAVSAAAALVSENAAAADAVLTAADVVTTNADVVLTGLDVTATNADVVSTNADVVSTNADVVTTTADAAATTIDAAATAADVILTAADVVLTHADVVLTNADVVLTGLDAVATAADAVSTAADAAALSTHLTATEDMSNKTFTDELTFTEISTPSTPASGDRAIYPKSDGKFYQINDAGVESEMGAGGGGSPTTIHLIKANDDSDTDFTIKSIDDVLPDFDGTDTLGATFSVPSSGSEALLSNDDDHAVYKFATTTSTVYDAVGRSFNVPRYARGRDILCEFQYRTADTSGASANGDYMVWIVDDTNMVNTTTTSTGAQAAGSSLVVGTSTGMAVGDKIWVGETGGTTQVTEAHITAIADSTHVTLSEAVTLTSGDRLVTGVLSDVLTTLNAADSDTNLEGESFKKYVQVPATCASIKFLVQQLTTETDSFLYFDNILIDSDPFKKVETQEKEQFGRVRQALSAMTDITGEVRFNLATASITTNDVTGNFLVEDDGSAATKWTIQKENLLVDMDFVIECNGLGTTVSIYKNGAEVDKIHGQATSTQYLRQFSYKDNPSVGDYYTFYASSMTSSAALSSVNFRATPQKGTSIIVESAENSNNVNSIALAGNGGEAITANTEDIAFAGSGTGWSVGAYTVQYDDSNVHLTCMTFNTTSDAVNINLFINGVDYAALHSGITSTVHYCGGIVIPAADINAGDVISLRYSATRTLSNDSTLHWLKIVETQTTEYKPLLAIPTITVGQEPEYFKCSANLANFWDGTGNQSTFDISAIPLTGSLLVEWDDTTQTRLVAKTRIELNVTGYANVVSGNGLIGYSSSAQILAYDISPTTGYFVDTNMTILLEAGDYVYFTCENCNSRNGGISILATPILGQQNHAAIISAPSVLIEEVTSNVNAGSSSSLTMHTRVINSLSGDIAAVGITLTNGTTGIGGTNNEFTLPAGKYEIEWSTPSVFATYSQSQLYNQTDSVITKDGKGVYSVAVETVYSGGKTLVTLTKDTAFRIKQYIHTARASDGLGQNSSGIHANNTATTDTYTQVTITRKA